MVGELSTKFAEIERLVYQTYPIAAIYFACVGTIGVSFNLIVFYVVSADRKILTPMNSLLLNLSVSDTMISLIGSPVAFINCLHGDWYFGETFCTIYGFLMAFFGITSMTTIAALAFERYLIICRPFTTQITWKFITICITSVWTYSFMITVPPLFGWGSYELEAENISCSVNWSSRTCNAQTYIFMMYILALAGPVALIVISYFFIFMTVFKTAQFRNDLNVLPNRNKEKRIALMVFLIAAGFLVAWGPYAVCSFLISFTNLQLSAFLLTAPCFFAKSSPCYNPLIYFFLNTQFRNSLFKKFKLRRWLSNNSIMQGRAATITELKNIPRPHNLVLKSGEADLESPEPVLPIESKRKETVFSVINFGDFQSERCYSSHDDDRKSLFQCKTEPTQRKKNRNLSKHFSLPLLIAKS